MGRKKISGVFKRTWKDPKTGKLRESKLYTIRYTKTLPDGSRKQVVEPSGSTQKEHAEELLRKRQNEEFMRRHRPDLLADLERAERRKTAKPPTVADAQTRWIEHAEINAQATLHHGVYEYAWSLHRTHLGARTLLKSLTLARLQKYQSTLLSAGLAPSTVNYVSQSLQTSMRLLFRDGILDELPAFPGRIKIKTKSGRYLSADELESVLEHLGGTSRLAVILAHETGIRRGALCELRWDQVDFEAGVLRLESAQVKTAELRSIPLTKRARDELLAHAGQPGEKVIDVRRNTVSTHFRRAVRKAGIEPIEFRRLRNTACLNWRRAGADIPELRAIFGHSTVEMVLHYNQVDELDLKEIAANLDKAAARRLSEARRGFSGT